MYSTQQIAASHCVTLSIPLHTVSILFIHLEHDKHHTLDVTQLRLRYNSLQNTIESATRNATTHLRVSRVSSL